MICEIMAANQDLSRDHHWMDTWITRKISSYSAGGVEEVPLAATSMCREWHYTEKEGESERDLGQIHLMPWE